MLSFVSTLLAITTLTTSLAAPAGTPHLIYERQASGGFFIKASNNPDPNQCFGTTQVPGNDVPIFNVPCTGTDARYVVWDIAPGNNAQGIVLRGPKGNFCLDATTQAGTGPAKVYTCYPGAPQQTFYFTDDKHIAITGGTKCLSYNGGGCGLGGCAPGYVQCSSDQYQTWNAVPAGTTPPPPTSGVQIHPLGDPTKCITWNTRAAFDGEILIVSGCLALTDPFIAAQLWDIKRNVGGAVKITTGGDLCLDAGATPNANGQQITIRTCNAALPQQNWYYTDDNHIAITGGTTCLDVKKEDGYSLQTWQCGSDVQQIFTV